jgi:hypothetical protein
MRALFFCAALLFCVPANAATVFSEDVGNPSAAPTPVGTYAQWQNNGTLTFTGNSSVFNSAPTSTGYTGASGLGYVSIKTTPTLHTFLDISSINTSAYDGTFTLTFGAYKSTTAADMTDLTLAYSSDGTTYTPIAIPAQPTGAGTDAWRLLTFSNITLPTVSNLHLRWTNNANAFMSYAVDDIALNGTLVPEPSSFIAFLVGGLGCLGKFLIRRRKAA